jgi:hypothetical protein
MIPYSWPFKRIMNFRASFSSAKNNVVAFCCVSWLNKLYLKKYRKVGYCSRRGVGQRGKAKKKNEVLANTANLNYTTEFVKCLGIATAVQFVQFGRN